jgi:hypothetical protein
MLVEWATEEWFAEAIRSSQHWMKVTPGADMVTQYVITDTPRGTIKYVEEKRDGRLSRLYLGEDLRADAVITMTYNDVRRLITELTTSDRLASVRVEGNGEKIKPFIPIRRSESFQKHMQHMREVTVWPSDSQSNCGAS